MVNLNSGENTDEGLYEANPGFLDDLPTAFEGASLHIKK